MTQKKYPTILEQEVGEGTASADVVVYLMKTDDDLMYFDGHFDQAAILPGVVQLDWAVFYGKNNLHVSGDFSGMEAVKFQNVIKAGQQFNLELKYDRDKQKLHFKYFSDAGPHSSGRIIFSTAEDT
ncbi:MAG: hypothetical protein ACRBCS_10890 [Cellvibrionaceae bacterium]